MTEVDERRPEPSRRGWVVGGVAALLLAMVAFNATRPPPDAQEDARPGPTESAALPGTPAPEPSASPTAGAPQWQLPRLSERTGLLLAVGGVGLRVLDVDSGRFSTAPMPTLAATEPVAAIPGGWLVFQREHCRAVNCDTALYAHTGGRARLVARAEQAVLDPDGRSMWLSGHTYRNAEPDSNPRWLEHRRLTGESLRRRIRLRPRERLAGVTVNGPVIAYPTNIGGRIAVLDHRDDLRPAIVVNYGVPLAVSGSKVAWTAEPCPEVRTGSCQVSVTDVVTGATTHIVTTAAPVQLAALDPAGEHLAIAFGRANRPRSAPGGGPAVAVFRVATGEPLRVGLRSPPFAQHLAWAPDGRYLVVLGLTVDVRTFETQHRLVVWRPGFRTARSVLAFDPDGPAAIAVGP